MMWMDLPMEKQLLPMYQNAVRAIENFNRAVGAFFYLAATGTHLCLQH